MQPASLSISKLRSCSDFFLSPSKLWIFRSSRCTLCILRYLLGVFYGGEGLIFDYENLISETRYSIYFLFSTIICICSDAFQTSGSDIHWIRPHCPVIFEFLSGLITVTHSAIALYRSNTVYTGPVSLPPDIFASVYNADRKINGSILPLLILLSGLIIYHVYIKLEERKSRYQNYRNGVRPVILFMECGDPVAYFPRIGSEIPMLSVDSLLQAQNSEEGMTRD